MDKSTAYQFDCMIETCTPRNILRSLTEVWGRYLLTLDQGLPANFKEMSRNFYVLINFFQIIDEEMSKIDNKENPTNDIDKENSKKGRRRSGPTDGKE